MKLESSYDILHNRPARMHELIWTPHWDAAWAGMAVMRGWAGMAAMRGDATATAMPGGVCPRRQALRYIYNVLPFFVVVVDTDAKRKYTVKGVRCTIGPAGFEGRLSLAVLP